MGNNYNLAQDRLFDFSKKETLIYRFLQTCAYFANIDEDGKSFLDFPNQQECDSILEDRCMHVRYLIDNEENSTPNYLFDLDVEVSLILFFREELIREMADELDWNMGISGYESEYFPLKSNLEKDLKEIVVNEELSFLKNVYMNICSKNEIMKIFTSTMFLNGMTNREFIDDFDYETLTDYIPEMIYLYYWINMFNETQDTNCLKEIDGTIDLDIDVDCELNENTIRDYIGDFVEKTIVNNSKFIKQLMVSMIENGREQNRLRK